MKRRDAIKGFAAIGAGLVGAGPGPWGLAAQAHATPVQPQAPWGPIAVEGAALRLTPDKQYDLSALFPAAMSVNGGPILAAPIKMLIQLDGGIVQEVAGSGDWSKTDPGRVTGHWNWKGEGIALEATRIIEDDGLIIYELAFKPDAPVRIAQLQLQIPLARGLTKYLLRFPRIGASAAAPFQEGKWGYGRSSTDANGLRHPRSLTCHDGARGLQWACDSDAHMGSDFWGKQSNSRFEVDQQTDTMTLRFIEGLTPQEPSAATFGYKFYLYPLPPRNIVPRPYRLNRPDSETQGIAEYDVAASEGAGCPYRWMGSGIPRSTGSPTWASVLASARRQGAGQIAYTIANCWPNGDSLLPWKPEFRVAPNVLPVNKGFPNPPNTQYAENGSGAAYSLAPTDLTNAELRHLLFDRYRSMHRDLSSAGVYFDVAQPKPQTKVLDAWGREAFVHPILELRTLMRAAASYYWAHDGIVMQHPQNSFFPMVHSASANIWCPGEEQNLALKGLSNDLRARKRWYSNISDYQKGAEWAPQVFGAQGAFLPQIRYHENAQLSDRNSSAGNEYFATESLLGELLLRGMGFWHSFSDSAVVKRVYIALMQAKLEQAAEFVPFDGAKPPLATSSDPDARISGWRIGDGGVVLVVVNRSEHSKAIPLELAFDSAGAPRKLYSATALSVAEGRKFPFVSNLKGAGRAWTIDVPLRCFALLAFSTR